MMISKWGWDGEGGGGGIWGGREGRQKEKRGVSSSSSQQMDRCTSLPSTFSSVCTLFICSFARCARSLRASSELDHATRLQVAADRYG